MKAEAIANETFPPNLRVLYFHKKHFFLQLFLLKDSKIKFVIAKRKELENTDVTSYFCFFYFDVVIF